MSLSDAELLIAAKNRAWEVIQQWRDKPMCDDETLAAMVAKAVIGGAGSASEAADLSDWPVSDGGEDRP